MYNIDFKRLALLLTPTHLRKPMMLAILNSVVEQISTMHRVLTSKRIDYKAEMEATPQVCSLKRLLNHQFGVSTFEIEDVELSGDWLMLYSEDEEDGYRDYVPVIENDPYIVICSESVIDRTSESFVVFYPGDEIEVGSDSYKKMQAIVNTYRLAGKTALYKPLTE